jgi:DMSO/TMAO reductase YedYZ molybdopterin-dependent catalytic subunit
MTPRGTDWSLALLVAGLFGTGMLSLVSGHASSAWVFTLHGAGGAAFGLVLGWKLRRVWPRVLFWRRWDRRTIIGVLTSLLAAGSLISGIVWSFGGDVYVAGFNLLNWHITLSVILAALVVLHGLARAKPLRFRDVAARRHLLQSLGIAGVALVGWKLQRPVATALQWRGSRRRWTGSYEQGSFAGNAFPATSWVADRPRPLNPAAYRLHVTGLVAQPLTLTLAELSSNRLLTATLDCTGGFYSTQHWRGSLLSEVLAQAQPLQKARYVRIISHTGYRWSFPLAEAPSLLLATIVGDEPLSHGHGAPVRLVAPDHRGFQWVKWVVQIDVHEVYDHGAAPSTVWSSATAAGRGEV